MRKQRHIESGICGRTAFRVALESMEFLAGFGNENDGLIASPD